MTTMVHQLLEKHRLDFPFADGDESDQRARYYFLQGWLADVFADPKFREDFLSELKRQNPYPSEIFTPPSDEDWNRVDGVLDAAGISSTQIFSKWGRDLFDNCIELSISRLLFDFRITSALTQPAAVKPCGWGLRRVGERALFATFLLIL